MIAIHPLSQLPEIAVGANLAELLLENLSSAGLLPMAGSDVLVVTQKIVSKAEGRFVHLATVVPGAEAERLSEITGKDARLVELVLGEAENVVRAAPHVLITRHRLGHVMANSGIDRSISDREQATERCCFQKSPTGPRKRCGLPLPQLAEALRP